MAGSEILELDRDYQRGYSHGAHGSYFDPPLTRSTYRRAAYLAGFNASRRSPLDRCMSDKERAALRMRYRVAV